MIERFMLLTNCIWRLRKKSVVRVTFQRAFRKVKSLIKYSNLKLVQIIVKGFAWICGVCGKEIGEVLTRPRYFKIWEKSGFHITRNHFYEPIPDTRKLKDDLWLKQSELVEINVNEEAMISFLSTFSSKFKDEFESFPRNKMPVSYQYYVYNGRFGSLDGEIYYCMIRYFQPKRIIEIGAGYSTYLAAEAILKNREAYGIDAKLIAIDPYPNDTLRKGFPGLSKLIAAEAQDIELSEFKKLKENDILFIDSSHVLKIGNDVQYIFLEVLPRLSKGVLVHIHDIFLPSEYPKNLILKVHKFRTEQYLLQAFLTYNNAFEVIWGGRYMQLKYPEKLDTVFSSWKNKYKREDRWPASFWIRKIR